MICRLACLAASFVCCAYESGGGRDGETERVDAIFDASGGLRDGGASDSGGILDGSSNSGCNPATGMGCICGACPQASDTCVSMSGAGGGFCSNACTAQNQDVTCALLPGQPGTSVCGLELNAGASAADHCLIMCDSAGNCPAGMTHPPMMSPCICQGP